MANFIKRLSIVILITASLCLSGCGICSGIAKNILNGTESNKTLPTYFGDSQVIAARFYEHYADDFSFEDLPEEKLPDLVNTLDSMKLKSHAFHTDYYWSGQFGIELTLNDGNFLTYDGTRLTLQSSAVDESTDSEIRSTFIEVTNCEFWDEMRSFFPSIGDRGFPAW